MSQEVSDVQSVTLKTISKMFGIPLWTLRKWAAQRRFSLYKVNTRIYVNPSEFLDWWRQYYIRVGANDTRHK